MTVYVIKDSVLIDKRKFKPPPVARSHLPAPMISRMEPFESPVTGKEITSWRERDRDMAAVGAVDPRDLPRELKRGRAVQKKEAEHAKRPADDTFKWRDPA